MTKTAVIAASLCPAIAYANSGPQPDHLTWKVLRVFADAPANG
jgi:hypothetical protein